MLTRIAVVAFVRLSALVALAVVLPGCDLMTGASNITYTVSGNSSTRVSLTYESESGTSQISSRTVPWTYTFRADRDDFLYVSAQIVQGSGPITVAIEKDGDVYKSANASGFAAIATASGSN